MRHARATRSAELALACDRQLCEICEKVAQDQQRCSATIRTARKDHWIDCSFLSEAHYRNARLEREHDETRAYLQQSRSFLRCRSRTYVCDVAQYAFIPTYIEYADLYQSTVEKISAFCQKHKDELKLDMDIAAYLIYPVSVSNSVLCTHRCVAS
jgi:hypothetical protein